MRVRKPLDRLAALSCERICTVRVPASAMRSSSRRKGRGVVVRQSRGSSPSRNPMRRFDSAASGSAQAQSSSPQAQSNCGPRRLSGSKAEKRCACAPLGKTSRRRVGWKAGRSLRKPTESSPLAPPSMTSRTACRVGPTSAMRRAPARTLSSTHSAPARVLPEPRPPSTSQSGTSGAIWSSRADQRQWRSMCWRSDGERAA